MNSVLEIPLDQVEVGKRLRSVDPDHAALIAESFRANGQIQPIEVRSDGDGYTLIAGAHRLTAARLLMSLNDRVEVRKMFQAFRIEGVETTYTVGGVGRSMRAREVLISGGAARS